MSIKRIVKKAVSLKKSVQDKKLKDVKKIGKKAIKLKTAPKEALLKKAGEAVQTSPLNDLVSISAEGNQVRNAADTAEAKPPQDPEQQTKPEEAKPEEGGSREDIASLRQEVDSLSGLISGLMDNFGSSQAAGESGAAQSGGSSGGGQSGGGQSGGSQSGGNESAPVQASNMAQSPRGNQGNNLNRTLTSLAIQVLTNQNQSMGGAGNQGGRPGPQPFPGQQAPRQGGRGINGNGNPRTALAGIYFNSGGPNNLAIRPETHQLVQTALGGGFNQALGGMPNTPMGMGMGPGVAGPMQPRAGF